MSHTYTGDIERMLVVQTPENIELGFDLASPLNRMIAYVIDYIILSVIMGIISYVFFTIFIQTYFSDSTMGDLEMGILIAMYVIAYPLSGYFILFELLWSGQTPGKRWVGIRVIRSTGGPVTFISVISRNLMRLADAFIPFQYAIGVLSMSFDTRYQRFGDRIAGTVVIRDKKDTTIKAKYSFRVPQTTSIPQEFYVPLSRQDFEVLMEYVAYYKFLNTEDRNRISFKLVKYFNARYALYRNAHYIPLMVQLNSQKGINRYQACEAILKDIIAVYSNETQS